MGVGVQLAVVVLRPPSPPSPPSPQRQMARPGGEPAAARTLQQNVGQPSSLSLLLAHSLLISLHLSLLTRLSLFISLFTHLSLSLFLSLFTRLSLFLSLFNPSLSLSVTLHQSLSPPLTHLDSSLSSSPSNNHPSFPLSFSPFPLTSCLSVCLTHTTFQV